MKMKMDNLLRMKVKYRVNYKYGEGFAVGVVPKAPRGARTKADVIAVLTIKKTNRGPNRGKLRGYASYYTPDEAMSIGLGLLKSVDHVMEDHFTHFRKHKDSAL
jgi:hypothetical protein